MKQEKPHILMRLCHESMPYGKYKGTMYCDLPISYLEWFSRKGMPQGELGMLLSTMYEIKLNGLDSLLRPLRKSPSHN